MGNSCGCCCNCLKGNCELELAGSPTQAELTPVELTSIANTLKTGDICAMYREGIEQTHYAMFVMCEDLGDHSPLLLLKGKTKPLPLGLFKREHEKNLRHVRIVSANGRMFYGDYVKVLIYKLKQKQAVTGASVDKVAEVVRKLNYPEEELKLIEDVKTSDARRSQYVCTFMLAHMMSLLGCMSVQPHTVTPENFLNYLDLDEPISIQLPETNTGPCISGSPPFFVKLMLVKCNSHA